MRRSLIVVVSAVVLFLSSSTPASAQGVNWGGFYVGGFFGFGVNAPDATATEIGAPFNGLGHETDIAGTGGTSFGGVVGLRHRIGDAFVIGGEFGAGLNRYSGEGASGPGNDTMASYRGGFTWNALARAGYAFNNVTPYFTAGVLGVSTDVDIVDDCNQSPCGPATTTASASGSKTAFTWGIGAEFGIGDRPLSIRAEWLRHDFRTIIDATSVDFPDVVWRFNPHIPQGTIRVVVTWDVGRE